ncbi:catalase family protein [Sphingomonas sp. BIUV-7]|uniref:Catalase family protein n=1 Tax=Sphingomonas natans TaxID=3063330 RepID=A0ABT8Y3A7_9SPHN|nr:catalase family protein [Sphingomonas sp. BIUV-7]MDO6412794.1 catalase family protein [Sphingomonas sp. BIUV-7]
MTTQPVRYAPSVETIEPDEAEAIKGLKQTFQTILDTTSKDYGHAVRGVHAKSHGIVRGTLTILDTLPIELAQGLFAQPGRYEAVLRISTAPGDILDDSVSAPRGVGLKIFGVPGDRLPGSNDGEQDFLMVNGPVFGAPTPAAFLKNLKLLAATTDKGEGLKKVLSATLRAVEGAIEAVGGSSVLISQLGGTPETHPLGDTYYSQTAFRYGDHIAKFSLKPISPALTELTGDKVNVSGRPDALREDVREVIASQGGTWQLCVQLCTDLEAMPVENPTVVWDETVSPFVPVATLEVAPQVSWEHGVSDRQEDALSFSPWHGIAAHQPLGSVNRARHETYEFSANHRSTFNGCPMHQVKQLEDLDA